MPAFVSLAISVPRDIQKLPNGKEEKNRREQAIMFNSYNYVYCAWVSFSCVVFFARKIVKIFQFGSKRNNKEGGDLDVGVSIIYMVN